MNTFIFISNVEQGPKEYRTTIVYADSLGGALLKLKKLKHPIDWGDINEVVECTPDGAVIQNRNMQEAPITLQHVRP